MQFFDSFWKASFYQEGKAVSFWRALGKIVLVVFFVSIGYAIVFYDTVGKKIPGYLNSYSSQALEGFPPDLIITVHDGTLSKNIPGELKLYMLPKEIMDESTSGKPLPKYLVTINDEESISLESYEKSNALVLLAKDGLATRDDKGIKMSSYKDMSQSGKDFTFSRDDIRTGVTWVNSYANHVPSIIGVSIILLVTIFSPFGYLFIALFYGLVVMVLSRWVLMRKVTFDESYILSLYALPPVIIVSSIVNTIPYIKNLVSYIPFLTTILIIGFLALMFRVKKHSAHQEIKV